jgi:FtsZ-binding cell division protein ZapB
LKEIERNIATESIPIKKERIENPQSSPLKLQDASVTITLVERKIQELFSLHNHSMEEERSKLLARALIAEAQQREWQELAEEALGRRVGR